MGLKKMATADLFTNPSNIMDALTTLANSNDVMFLVIMGAFVFLMHVITSYSIHYTKLYEIS